MLIECFLEGACHSKSLSDWIREIQITDEHEGLVEASGIVNIDDYVGKVLIAKHPQGKNKGKLIERIMEGGLRE